MKNLIIDGNNLIHRAYWIAKNVKKTENSNLHIHLFLNCIKTYVQKYKPTAIYCCWDEKREKVQNVRKDLNENYKANRDKEYAKEVYSRIGDIKELMSSLGIKNIFPYMYEADDTMFILSKKLPGSKVIVTVDKDLYQTVNNEVLIFDPIKKIEIRNDNLEKICGCTVKELILTKALRGDRSDNVIGIKGFGEKSVQKYFANEIVLTQEQQTVFEHNLQLVDLNRGGITSNIEVEYIEKQLAELENASYGRFVDLCKHHDLTTVLQKKHEWNELFFFKDVYTGLLETLFAS